MAGDKVETLIDKYDLSRMAETLVESWTHDDSKRRRSVRELTLHFNTEIILSVLDEHTNRLVLGDYSVADIVHLLRARDSNAEKYDNVTEMDIREIEYWLTDQGVLVDEVADDLISYGTMHAYLKEIRGAVSPDSPETEVSPSKLQQQKIDSLKRFANKREGNVDSRLESLRNRQLLPDIPPQIELTIEFVCPSCSQTQSLESYINNQGCTSCELHTRDEHAVSTSSLSN